VDVEQKDISPAGRSVVRLAKTNAPTPSHCGEFDHGVLLRVTVVGGEPCLSFSQSLECSVLCLRRRRSNNKSSRQKMTQLELTSAPKNAPSERKALVP
jgi:hypothetical protein